MSRWASSMPASSMLVENRRNRPLMIADTREYSR
jgi:hypothetical protein